MGRENKMIGKIGERFAVEFLKKKGYKVMGTNIRTGFGEIDIVASKKKSLVFVEVKTRTSSSLGPPSISVTRAKQMRLVKNALAYLMKYGRFDSYWRIDVLSVMLDKDYEVQSMDLIENAVDQNYGGYG